MSKVDQSGFQLDKKELTKNAPFGVGGLVGGFVDWVNALDTNHDGTADICQVAPFVIKAMPFLQAIAPHVDPEKMIEWFVDHDFVINKKALAECLKQVFALALQAQNEIK